jgi:hypothetical protein
MISRPELASRAPRAARRGHHPAVALAVTAASQLMVVLDVTIVNIALPQIQRFAALPSPSPWLSSARAPRRRCRSSPR